MGGNTLARVARQGGRYDGEATAMLRSLKADGVILVVVNGAHGTGVSHTAELNEAGEASTRKMPELLRMLAASIERDVAQADELESAGNPAPSPGLRDLLGAIVSTRGAAAAAAERMDAIGKASADRPEHQRAAQESARALRDLGRELRRVLGTVQQLPEYQ